MIFNIEKYEDIIPEISRLYDVAVNEVVIDCPYQADVDHEQFVNLDKIGLLRVVTVRSDGELVGFHISTITSDIFYKDKKTSYVMHYYLLKEHRGGGKGLKMFEHIETLNKSNGIDRSFMSRKIHINNEKLFNCLGYKKIESNYEKYYDE